MTEATHRELHELADAIDRNLATGPVPAIQLLNLTAIATRLRQLADKETP